MQFSIVKYFMSKACMTAEILITWHGKAGFLTSAIKRMKAQWLEKKNLISLYNLKCEIYIGTDPTTDKKSKVILWKDKVLQYRMLHRTEAMPLKPSNQTVPQTCSACTRAHPQGEVQVQLKEPGGDTTHGTWRLNNHQTCLSGSIPL